MIKLDDKTRNIIIIVVILIVGVLLGRLFSPDAPIDDSREQVIQSLRREVNSIADINRGLENRLEVMDDSLIAQNNRIQAKDVEISGIKSRAAKKRGNIEILTVSQADSVIEKQFPNKEERSKLILIELAQGEEARELLNAASEKIGLLEQKGLNLEGIIIIQDLVITNQKVQLSKLEDIIVQKDEQLGDEKKKNKKLKRQKKLIGIGAGVLIVLSLLAK